MFYPLYYSLRHNDGYKDKKVLAKCAYWYWTALFAGRYAKKTNENSIQDTKRLFKFCHEGGDTTLLQADKKLAFDAQRYSDKRTLVLAGVSKDEEKDFNSNLQKGLLQLLVSNKDPMMDWQDASEKRQTIDVKDIENGNFDKHHIISFPFDRYSERKDLDHYLHSPMNVTYISRSRNRKVNSYITDEYYALNLHEKKHCLPDNFKEIVKEEIAKAFNEKGSDAKYKVIVDHFYAPRFENFKQMYESRMADYQRIINQ